MMSPVVVPRVETVSVPLAGGERVWVRVLPLLLACCGVEVAAALTPLTAAHHHDHHADDAGETFGSTVLVVAGTVTDVSEPAVVAAYESMPGPRMVLAFGACTASGGPYWDSYSVAKGIAHLVHVDLVVPGCPPRPEALLAGLSALVAGARPA